MIPLGIITLQARVELTCFRKKQIDDKVMALARSGSYTLNPLPPLSHARDVTSRVYRSQREGLSSAPF